MTSKHTLTSGASTRLPFLALGGILIWLASSPSASAGTQCYDLSGPAVGTDYEVGQSIDARHATVNFQEFRPNGQPTNHPNPKAEIIQSDLPQGGAPSLSINSVLVQVRPDKPVQEVTLKYAENTGAQDAQKQNFGVNGERLLDLVGGFEQLEGRDLGRPQLGGPARVSVTAKPDSTSLPTWVRGTITLTALDQGISAFAIGANSQLFIDDVCLTE